MAAACAFLHSRSMRATLQSGNLLPVQSKASGFGLPRPMADARTLLGDPAVARAPIPVTRQIALIFKSADAAARAEELMEQLWGSLRPPLILHAQRIGFTLREEESGNPTLAFRLLDEQWSEGSMELREEAQEWFRGWLHQHHAVEGFAVVVALPAAHSGDRVVEEAKLAAAVYHGVVATFPAAEHEPGNRRGQLCCSW